MNKKIIPISQPTITQLEIDYVNEAVSSGWVSSLGPYVDRFENDFAKFCGTKYALTVANGTVAIHLALVSFGISEGDEVIIPDLTFIATANVVKYTGATVVFADIESDSLCIDPQSIEAKITSKTKAIIPVHLYGHPANMTEINKIAAKHNLIVIEDAAEAHGAMVNEKKVGSLGHCATFSFYGNKIITTGEGGMITTNDKELYDKMKYLRDHAMSKEKRYWHTEIGYNYRLTNIQAALGCAQLERIEDIIQKKEKIFQWYSKGLEGISTIRLNYCAPWAKHVYWMVCLELVNCDASQRDQFIGRLKELGIDSRPYFYAVSDMPMYSSSDTVVTHLKSRQGINLPSFYDIQESDVAYICQSVKALVQELK